MPRSSNSSGLIAGGVGLLAAGGIFVANAALSRPTPKPEEPKPVVRSVTPAPLAPRDAGDESSAAAGSSSAHSKSHKPWDPSKHPRDAQGRFIPTTGKGHHHK